MYVLDRLVKNAKSISYAVFIIRVNALRTPFPVKLERMLKINNHSLQHVYCDSIANDY